MSSDAAGCGSATSTGCPVRATRAMTPSPSGRLGQWQLDPTDEPDERRDRRTLEIRMHDHDAVARDQLRDAARDLERDLAFIERSGQCASNGLQSLEALGLSCGQLREPNLLDVMDDLLREQLDRAQATRSRCPFLCRDRRGRAWRPG